MRKKRRKRNTHNRAIRITTIRRTVVAEVGGEPVAVVEAEAVVVAGIGEVTNSTVATKPIATPPVILLVEAQIGTNINATKFLLLSFASHCASTLSNPKSFFFSQ